MLFVAIMAIALTCLGLYGLLSFRLLVRMKEFSIRKVLGAGNKQVVILTIKEYIWILAIGFIIGAPIGTYAIQTVAAGLFPVSKAFSILPVVVALIVTLFAITLTVFSRVSQAVNTNPADVLSE